MKNTKCSIFSKRQIYQQHYIILQILISKINKLFRQSEAVFYTAGEWYDG